MKIGIITFHWPDNYGAVLQCYALQNYLEDLGHQVEVINYQPFHLGLYYMMLAIHPNLIGQICKIRYKKRKNVLLDKFRKKYLHLTKRCYTAKQLENTQMDYDVIISGSDQVLNPSFTLCGERKPTSAYYLSFGKGRKIGYALSFGCTEYPADAAKYAEKWIHNFDAVGVREATGIEILNQLGYDKSKMVVPDPTILNFRNLYKDIVVTTTEGDYYCVYSIRHPYYFDIDDDVRYVDDEHQPVPLEKWLGLIIHSKGLVTNSYHGMIMAIISHVPFIALSEEGGLKGMNDRFTTLLRNLGLEDRIVPFDSTPSEVIEAMEKPISWAEVNKEMEAQSQIGANYLKEYGHV